METFDRGRQKGIGYIIRTLREQTALLETSVSVP